jgi:cytochrome c oxidase assembly protein subunit 15
MGLIIAQVVIGVVLEFFNMPPAFQVMHLVGIALMVCVQFLLILILRLRTE